VTSNERGSPALVVEGVELRYGGLTALRGVDLTVHHGQVDGLIGPNGAGKTSLFDVVTGLTRPTQGRILLDGHDITSKSATRRARLGLARTFQRLELFSSLTVRENIQVAAEATRSLGRTGSRSAEAFTTAQLARTGLTPVASVRVDTLPTGIARIVEVARALASEPTVLLLDEPASGLDPPESEALARLLDTLAADGLAVLLVEHDVDLVIRTCATLTVLDRGRVIASGDPGDVQRSAAVQQAYLGPVYDIPAPAEDRPEPAVSEASP